MSLGRHCCHNVISVMSPVHSVSVVMFNSGFCGPVCAYAYVQFENKFIVEVMEPFIYVITATESIKFF